MFDKRTNSNQIDSNIWCLFEFSNKLDQTIFKYSNFRTNSIEQFLNIQISEQIFEQIRINSIKFLKKFDHKINKSVQKMNKNILFESNLFENIRKFEQIQIVEQNSN